MFVELEDGSLLNLNKAWKIYATNTKVIADYGNATTDAILYDGTPSECKDVLRDLGKFLGVNVSVLKKEKV